MNRHEESVMRMTSRHPKRPWRWGYSGLPCMIFVAAVLVTLPWSLWMMQWKRTNGSNRRLSSVEDGGTATTSTNYNNNKHLHGDKMNILYIVTSGGKWNSGTTRFVEQTEPLILESVASLLENPRWHVDVYLILGYAEFPMQEEFQGKLQAIHPEIQLRVWRQALPILYNCDEWLSNNNDPVGRGAKCRNGKKEGLLQSDAALSTGNAQLARQHRLVVKDFFAEYDFFVAFEDDMLITKYHVDFHLEWMARVREMYVESKARKHQTNATILVATNPDDAWKVQGLKANQLLRLRPAFLRVEVSEEPRVGGTVSNISSTVKVTDDMVSEAEAMINASRCCHRPKHLTLNPAHAENRTVSGNDLLLWETSILGYGIRRLGNHWVGTLPGPGRSFRIPDYWTGRILNQSARARPRPGDPTLISQSAGWMGTRRDILEFNELCEGSFLPPFDAYPQDGLWRNNVEYWSGGIQLWSETCNIARFVDLQQFDRHFVYHTSNNKQHGSRIRTRIVSASVLLAQLIVAQKGAESDMHPNISAYNGFGQ